jgi:hypothetical protein
VTITAPRTSALRTAFAWHRPLMAVALAMAGLVLVGLAGLVVDQRTITALPAWAKPTKFAISVLIFAVTWSVRRRVYQVMAISIAVLFFATLYLVAALFRARDNDPARTFAIRAGGVLAIVGMAIGQLMTDPTRAQIAAGGTIVGAHTVGIPDGGPGLPLLGWSSVAGDLRIGHFVGMHALQVIPLVLIALELIAPRVPLLRDAPVRLRLVAVTSVGYAGLIALVTWQALRGQSIVDPDALTLGALAALVGLVALGAGWAVTSRAATSRAATSRAATSRTSDARMAPR